jgi:O-methyltransferase
VSPEQLVSKYPIISDQITATELTVILRMLETALHQTNDGVVVEMGCYQGTTSLFIQRMLQQNSREFHVYDSFAGLPDKTAPDISPAGEQFKTGELFASKKSFITNFKKTALPLPIVHKCWFNELDPADMPNAIAFAFLDGDYYESIIDSLKLVWPRLVSGAVVVVDDYQNEALPGAKRAVDEWLQRHPATLRSQASLAILQKSVDTHV